MRYLNCMLGKSSSRGDGGLASLAAANISGDDVITHGFVVWPAGYVQSCHQLKVMLERDWYKRPAKWFLLRRLVRRHVNCGRTLSSVQQICMRGKAEQWNFVQKSGNKRLMAIVHYVLLCNFRTVCMNPHKCQ